MMRAHKAPMPTVAEPSTMKSHLHPSMPWTPLRRPRPAAMSGPKAFPSCWPMYRPAIRLPSSLFVYLYNSEMKRVAEKLAYHALK
jgi:hypothetical protein